MKNCIDLNIKFLVGLASLLFAVGDLAAQEESQLNPRRQRIDRPKPTEPVDRTEPVEKTLNRRELVASQIDAHRREELRMFLRENLPEMERVMGALQDRQPAQFQRALISVNESYSRLQAIKKTGNETLYRNALENWKVDAQIKMISAQLSFRENPALEVRLKRLVARQVDNRIAYLRDEQARLRRQLERTEANLSRLQSERDADIERRVNQQLQASERARARTENAKPKNDSTIKTDRQQLGNQDRSQPSRDREPELPD
jgi:hypothetical protein